ncbi:response regulator transcription factor [Mucilaginibacter sp. ZT4R22]|uniref:Response regulator transcription factor n=1 Tax=Mucilaginibacter pankratovii TaxID=2772110 RepID=A0ABR7WXT0_9SPHI|nr:response regulator transcription factor [Mucilaginibacter pankratovii]MBD1367091.1 response regulator transcription factor [Mucilaginibacter pankratovii]
MIKILLVEDQTVVRVGVRLLLEKEGDIEVIAEAGSGKDALQLLAEGHKPDIIITDINLPHTTGFELLTQVRQTFPEIKVIILSTVDEDKYIVEAFKTGATAYMLKSVKPVELIFAIRHIHLHTERFLCNQLALKLLERFLRTPEVSSKGITIMDVSKRELEILTLIAEGYTNQEIADQLFTSKRTVEIHRQNMIEKAGVRNTAALVRYAMLNNMVA